MNRPRQAAKLVLINGSADYITVGPITFPGQTMAPIIQQTELLP